MAKTRFVHPPYAVHWVAPPNWPPAPEGWFPEWGWKPDPSWGPAPEGWNAWRDPWGRPSDPPWDERDMGPPAAPGTPPGPLIRDWTEAEVQTVLLLNQAGFRDVRRTGSGSDGGLDVVGARVAAQVKWHQALVGRPDLQRLVGAAGSGRELVFVSRAGYSALAVAFADQVKMALVTLDAGARPRAHNGFGRGLLARLPQ